MDLGEVLASIDYYLTSPMEDGKPRSLIYSGVKGSINNLSDVFGSVGDGQYYLMPNGQVSPVEPQKVTQAVIDWGIGASPAAGLATKSVPGPMFGTFVSKYGKYGPRQDFQVDLARALAEKDWRWIDFGKVPKKNLAGLEELDGGLLKFNGDRLIISPEGVRHLWEQRVVGGEMSPAEVADMVNSAVHGRSVALKTNNPNKNALVNKKVNQPSSPAAVVSRGFADGDPVLTTSFKARKGTVKKWEQKTKPSE